MDFKDKLNEYIDRLECTAKDLAESSGLSAATLSRYRSGERIPDSEQLKSLTGGIITLAEQKGIADFSAEFVENELLTLCAEVQNFDYEKLRSNFNTLLTVLSVNVSELARSITTILLTFPASEAVSASLPIRRNLQQIFPDLLSTIIPMKMRWPLSQS